MRREQRRLRKRLEDAVQHLGVNPDAGVAHAEHSRGIVTAEVTATSPFDSVNLMALVKRFAITWRMRTGSPAMVVGPSGIETASFHAPLPRRFLERLHALAH